MLSVNKIHEGDCLELFKKIPDNSVDLIIADPPYGIDKDFGNEKKWGLSEMSSWFDWMKLWLDESSRVLKEGGAKEVWGFTLAQGNPTPNP